MSPEERITKLVGALSAISIGPSHSSSVCGWPGYPRCDAHIAQAALDADALADALARASEVRTESQAVTRRRAEAGGMSEQRLLATTDAAVWARVFMETVDRERFDAGYMIGWFANAIETAKSHERRSALHHGPVSDDAMGGDL